MPRRQYYSRLPCVHPSCPEKANYVFETRAEQQATIKRLHDRGGWRCVRHTHPEEVLSDDTPLRETVLVVEQRDVGRFFGHSGFVCGPGFKAYAEDFPAGTRLIVTARIEPASSAHA